MYTLILVDYNSLDATVAFIERCRHTLQHMPHVVVVENGNQPDAPAFLAQHYGAYQNVQLDGISKDLYLFQDQDLQILYCPSGENMGYARGNNLGAQIARARWNDPFYIISNNDLVFEKSFDLTITQSLFDTDPKIGIVGPQVLTPAGEQQSPHKWISGWRRLIVFIWIWAVGGALSAQRRRSLFSKYCDDMCYDAQTGPCAWVSGCFFITRAAAFHQAGMFDPNTFLYGEELILSRRMEAAGFSVWFCRDLEIIHQHAQTTKNAFSTFRMLEIDFRSIWYYYKTYTHTSWLVLTLAKWNFALYKLLLPLWIKIKKLLGRDKEESV